MKGPATFGVANDFSFDKEECYKLHIPTMFISLKASSWLDEEEIARKIVCSNVGTVKDADVGLSSLIQGLQKLKGIQELPMSVKAFAAYVQKYYKRLPIKTRFESFFTTILDAYLSDKAKVHAANKMLQENYKIHAGLSAKTADDIIEAAILTKGKEVEEEYASESSCKSEDYGVSILCEDDVTVS